MYAHRLPPRDELMAKAEQVTFLRSKYGLDLLVDAAWVRDMPTFMRKGPHRLEFYDILFVTKGEGRYGLDGCWHDVRAGTILFTAPGQIRRWDARGVDGICLFFLHAFITEFLDDADFLDRLPYFNCEPEFAALIPPVTAGRQLRRRLSDMRAELCDPRADSEHLLRAQVYEVLIMLRRVHTQRFPNAALRTASPVTNAFRMLISRHANRSHRVGDYAARLDVSPNYLNALCKHHLGRTAKSVIDETLATEARRALAFSEASAEAISAGLGFKDPSYFARFFKRATGTSPSAFRARHIATGRFR